MCLIQPHVCSGSTLQHTGSGLVSGEAAERARKEENARKRKNPNEIAHPEAHAAARSL